MKHIILKSVVLGLALTACNVEDMEGEEEGVYEAAYLGTENNEEIFKGYLGGVFEITVDGVKYDSSEDWYNKEIEKIPARLAEAGYPDAEFQFDAEVGLDDFAYDTKVNLQSQGGTGWAGSSQVVPNDGSYEIKLPEGAFGRYQLKTVKRVSLTVNGDKKFCYNFLGLAKDYDLNPESRPIIIEEFETKLTAYKCSAHTVDDNGVLIPVMTGIVKIPLRKGDTKVFVRDSLGEPDDYTITGTSSKWLYRGLSNTTEDARFYNSAYCEINFDYNDKLSSVKHCNNAVQDYMDWNTPREVESDIE